MTQTTKQPKFLTPHGKAVYPRLNEPDTRWKPNGEFKITVRLDGSDDKVKSLVKELTKLYEDHIKKWRSEGGDKPAKKGGKAPEAIAPPFGPTYNDNDEETGEIDIRCALAHRVEPKGKKAYTQRPAVFDAKGNPWNPKILVGGGSTVRVQIQPYLWTSPLGAGMSLRMKAVQVLTLVAPGGDMTAYGFDKEDGFDVNSVEPGEMAEPADAGSDAPSADGKSGDY